MCDIMEKQNVVSDDVIDASVHMATRWTIRHGLMLLWFKDLTNVTEKLQFIDPTFRHSRPVPSSGVIYTLQQDVLLYV